MLRAMVAAATLVVVAGAAIPTSAQTPPAGFRGPVFRVEPETRTEHRRAGFVTGWVYNDGQGIAGLVRMKVEMLDPSGKVVSEHIGWAYGNVTAGGRAYFMIPIPPQSPPDRRVVVDSWVIQSFDGGPSGRQVESP
jgi:hypothetical protein